MVMIYEDNNNHEYYNTGIDDICDEGFSRTTQHNNKCKRKPQNSWSTSKGHNMSDYKAVLRKWARVELCLPSLIDTPIEFTVGRHRV